MRTTTALITLYVLLPSAIALSSFGLRNSATRPTSLVLSAAKTPEELIEQAARIRADIAKLEGKSLEEVEKEANDKKEAQVEAERLSKIARAAETPFDKGRMLNIPESSDEMITQAARGVERAYKDGIKRQTVRMALVAEGDSFVELNQWPGGAQQMSREAAKPLTEELLREIRSSPKQVLPPKIRIQDVWDFDGSSIATAEAQEGPESDVQALILANTDIKYSRDIETIDKEMGDRLFLLVNPFWRDVSSWGINLLSPGAKKKAQEVIFDQGYDETYVFLRFSVRGEFCAAVKSYPYDWQLFAYLEDETGWERPIRLGSSETEPNSALFTELLNERPEFADTRIMRQFKN